MLRTRLSLTSALLTAMFAAASLLVAPPASARMVLEDYAGYEPQQVCSPWAKPGTVALAHWLLHRYPGTRSMGISRACSVGGTSEHKEGRAFDWGVDVKYPRQKKQAYKLLDKLFAPDRRGNPAALARRMGIMYIIFNDKIYGSYRGFEAAPYLNYNCKTLKKCSRTLRHKDHMHISLTRAGGWGQTSWYRRRGVDALPVQIPGTKKLDMGSTAYYSMSVPVDGSRVVTPFKLARNTPYTIYVQGLYRTGPGSQVADPVCAWDQAGQTWLPITADTGFGLTLNGELATAAECNLTDHSAALTYTPPTNDYLTLQFTSDSPRNDKGVISVHIIQPQLINEVDQTPIGVQYPEPRPRTKPGPEARRLVDEKLDVPARARGGRLTDRALRAGRKYAVIVRGTATDGRSLFDAECVRWNRGWRYQQTQNLTAPADDHLDLYLDGVDLDLKPRGGQSGQCATDTHVYRTVFTAPVDGRARLKVWDPNDYRDNSGTLSVTIRLRSS